MPDNEQDALYPDLAQCGSLGKLLYAEFKRVGSPLIATGLDESVGGSIYWASVKKDRRSSDISVAKNKRLFLAPLWIKGVQLASLETPLLDVLARTLHAWLIEQYPATRLKVAFPDINISEAAPFYEDSPKAYVEMRWAILCTHVNKMMPSLYPVVRLAKDIPVLRQLLPYTSVDALSFSRCTGYPFSCDCPSIGPIVKDVFRVIGSSGEVLGCGNADKSLKVALANLPEDCGPAVHGTAEDLGLA